jgi:Effector protein/RTX calcium-binding nonapeptide repeat (4 copies)
MATEPSSDSSTNVRAAAGDPPVQINGTTVPATSPPAITGTTADGKTTFSQELFRVGDVSITRDQVMGGDQFADKVVLNTGPGKDNVTVDQRTDGTLDVQINGKKYEITLGPGQELGVRTGDGDDIIKATPKVTVNMDVDSGAGNDTITTGSGRDRVDGGAGNDTIKTGAGRDDVFGNTGNDTIDAGDGNDVVYGGDGNDTLRGGKGNDYLEGGKGNDVLEGGQDNDILWGGRGDDTLRRGKGNDRIYTGAGADKVDNQSGNDTVYGQSAADTITAAKGAKNDLTEVNMDTALGASVTVSGSAAFQQRVDADIEMLRSSPNGRQMLTELDRAADPTKGNGMSVTITELQNEQNGSAGPVTPPTYLQTDAAGVTTAGTGANTTVQYNPSFHTETFQVPVATAYHELSHAYNGVNGTAQQGTYTGPAGDPDNGVNNDERQAVGLNNSGAAFDFDRNPATPNTTANPAALTENGLRAEMGVPLRPNYGIQINPTGTTPLWAAAPAAEATPAVASASSMDPHLSKMMEAMQSADPNALRTATQSLANSPFGQEFRSQGAIAVDRQEVEAKQQQLPQLQVDQPSAVAVSAGPTR